MSRGGIASYFIYLIPVCRLWHKVSLGLQANDQTVATDEKFTIEDAQRKAVREREIGRAHV